MLIHCMHPKVHDVAKPWTLSGRSMIHFPAEPYGS